MDNKAKDTRAGQQKYGYQGIKFEILNKIQLKATLTHMMSLIDDNFTIQLINTDQYNDLEEYLCEYLFKSEIYRFKVLTLVRTILKDRWVKEVKNGYITESTNFECPEMEEMLKKVSDSIGNLKMTGFLYGQILEYIEGIGMSIFGFEKLHKNYSDELLVLEDFVDKNYVN